MSPKPGGACRALVLAHFHRKGAIRTDTIALLNEARNWFRRVVIVSTSLGDDELDRIPASVEVIRRENVGYDFYSYRTGLLRLLEGDHREPDLVELCLMNTSVLCFDPARLFRRVLGPPGRPDVYGIVKTYELREHLQSWFVGFSRAVLEDARFAQWWRSMVSIDDRSRVIRDYELGLSQLMGDCGYRLCGILDYLNRVPDPLINAKAENMAYLADIINLSKNPGHFHWQAMMNEFGIMKIDLLKTNRLHLDLSPLAAAMSSNIVLRRSVEEALEN